MMKKYLISLCVAFMTLTVNAVNVKISSGIDEGSVKSKMEQAMSRFLTEANAAQSAKREMSYGSLGLSQNVQESVSMLWENSPFECTDDEIVEKCIKTGSGYQVRNIPLEMKPLDGNFNEDEYQEGVFNFDNSGNIESFYLTLDASLYMSVIKSNRDLTDLRRRQLILDYVEHFRTAYNQKDMTFLNAIFSDDALIITGKVIQRKTGDGIPLPDKIEYHKQSKKEYLTKLSGVFKYTKYIHVTFDEIQVMRHPVKPDYYGVTLHQGYSTDRYHDDGYIFLLWDFRDEEHPQIHVRTWQPDAFSADGKTKTKIPKEEIFSLSDFDGL